MDIGGWDTHANQGAWRGQLANHMLEFSIPHQPTGGR
jgi:hypothetical protein